MNAGSSAADVIRNNTNKGIPIDLIKNGYLTDIKNEDGTNLLVNKQRSTICCEKTKII